MSDIITFGPVLLASLDRCYDAARRIICHFYLPPCGNSTLFELPTSVCKETCYTVQDMCGEEWENVVSMFEQNRLSIEPEGTTFIECEDTGKHLNPLPYNCSDLGILCECCRISCRMLLRDVLDLYPRVHSDQRGSATSSRQSNNPTIVGLYSIYVYKQGVRTNPPLADASSVLRPSLVPRPFSLLQRSIFRLPV